MPTTNTNEIGPDEVHSDDLGDNSQYSISELLLYLRYTIEDLEVLIVRSNPNDRGLAFGFCQNALSAIDKYNKQDN